MRTHDVIVVGAGPAGSTAAASLARRGHDVLLLDRAQFPRAKACGDGVPPGSIEILDGLGMGEAVRAAGFHAVRGIRLGSPWGRTWDATFQPRRARGEFYVAPRERLDALIKEHAAACGARFEQATVRALAREDGRVCGVHALVAGRETEIGARVVIGADGATSLVGRALGRAKSSPQTLAVALRAYVDGIETLPHQVEFYFFREYLPGYAWVFPLGRERANVGVILPVDRYRRRGRSLREHLDRFLGRPPIRRRLRRDAAVEEVATWQLPLATPRAPRRAIDGALLVGDAGGFVDALTGEGIHNALVSASIAADVTHEALTRRDTSPGALADFDGRCEAAIGRLVRRSWRLQRFVARVPLVLEALFIAASLGGGPVRALINRVSTDFVVEV